MDRPADVRVARKDDAELLFALARLSDEEWSLGRRDDNKIRAVIHLAVDKSIVPPGGLRPTFGVIDGSYGIEGAVGLYPTEPWNSQDHFLRGFFLFVHPACRKSTHAKHLLAFGNWFGDRSGLPVVWELLHPERTEAKARLYGRQARHVGGLYMHQPAAA